MQYYSQHCIACKISTAACQFSILHISSMCANLACLQAAHMSVQHGNAYSMHVDMLILGTTLSMNICARLTCLFFVRVLKHILKDL